MFTTPVIHYIEMNRQSSVVTTRGSRLYNKRQLDSMLRNILLLSNVAKLPNCLLQLVLIKLYKKYGNAKRKDLINLSSLYYLVYKNN